MSSINLVITSCYYVIVVMFIGEGGGVAFIMASFTAGLVIRFALKRFSISSALVVPEQRQAMLKLFLGGALNARSKVRRECSLKGFL